MIETIIGIICVIGVGWTSYKIGRREGAQHCLDILHDKRIISYDSDGQIVPNPFFIPEEN